MRCCPISATEGLQMHCAFVFVLTILGLLGLEQLLACLLALLERQAQISKFDCAVGVVRVLRC